MSTQDDLIAAYERIPWLRAAALYCQERDEAARDAERLAAAARWVLDVTAHSPTGHASAEVWAALTDAVRRHERRVAPRNPSEPVAGDSEAPTAVSGENRSGQ